MQKAEELGIELFLERFPLRARLRGERVLDELSDGAGAGIFGKRSEPGTS